MFSLRARGRALGLLLVGGALVTLITVLLPHSEMVKEGQLYAVIGLGLVAGVVAFAEADRFSFAGIHAGLLMIGVGLSVANYLVGPTALYAVLYSWAILYAFALFPRREALWHMAAIAVGYAIVLAIQNPTSAFVRWLLAMGTPFLAGLFISRVVSVAQGRSRVLSENEGRLRAIVDSAPDAFLMVDEQGTVLSWNRQAERVFGILPATALGREVSELIFAPEDRAAHVERRAGYFAGPPDSGPWEIETEMVRADGSRFPVEVVVSRVVADERDLLAVFITDISARIQQRREREQLYREQAARHEAEQMAGVVHGLQMLLDAALLHRRLEDMLEALLPRLCEVVNAETASVLLMDEEGILTVRASTGGTEDPPVRIAVGDGICGKAAQGRAPLLVQDPDPETICDATLRGSHSIISVPLISGDEVTAVIQVGVPPPRRFGDDDLMLLGLAADRVALVIEHAQVYEREARIAETLQRSLLPDRLPSLPGLEPAARYLPAASEAEVGGDWYDVIALGSGKVGLVMGDVAGKGLAAASMVGQLRSALRAYALEGHGPVQVVERLNRLVWSESQDSEMVTLVYVVVDPEEGGIEFVNAGHLPPIITGPDGCRFLEGPGSVPLGVMSFPMVEPAHERMEAGSTVLLYTDGVVETPGELLDDGLERLRAVVAGAGLEAEGLCDEVVRALVPRGGASDDVALLALHAPLLSEHFSLDLGRDPGELAAMRSLLRRWLAHADGTDKEIAEILTAAGEAAANAIEHSGVQTGRFQIDGALDDGRVQITVSDSGTWREHGERRNGRGRGLGLMRDLMDTVEVLPGGSGTTIRMSRRLGNGRPAVD